jgi:hypothetical protein
MPETWKAAFGAKGPFRKPERDHAKMAAIARVASKGVYAGGGPIAERAGTSKAGGRWGLGLSFGCGWSAGWQVLDGNYGKAGIQLGSKLDGNAPIISRLRFMILGQKTVFHGTTG